MRLRNIDITQGSEMFYYMRSSFFYLRLSLFCVFEVCMFFLLFWMFISPIVFFSFGSGSDISITAYEFAIILIIPVFILIFTLAAGELTIRIATRAPYFLAFAYTIILFGMFLFGVVPWVMFGLMIGIAASKVWVAILLPVTALILSCLLMIPASLLIISLAKSIKSLLFERTRKLFAILYSDRFLSPSLKVMIFRLFDLPPTFRILTGRGVAFLPVVLITMALEAFTYVPVVLITTHSGVELLQILHALLLIPGSSGVLDAIDVKAISRTLTDNFGDQFTYFFIFICVLPIHFFIRVLRKLIRRTSVKILMRTVPSPNEKTILFLRSFLNDSVMLDRYKTLSALRLVYIQASFRSLDELLFTDLWHIAPVVAFGRPGDKAPPYGARRRYVDHAVWRPEIQYDMERSLIIVVAFDETASLIWELEKIINGKFLGKAIILFPNNVTALNHLFKVLEILGISDPENFPDERVPIGMLFESQSVLILWSSRSSETEMQVAVRLGVHMILGTAKDMMWCDLIGVRRAVPKAKS